MPAKYICSIDEFMEKRKQIPRIEIRRGKRGLSPETVEAAWERLKKERE